MSGTTFLCLLGIIIAIAPVFMMALVMIDRWSMERTEDLIDDAVFEHCFDPDLFTKPWSYSFVSADRENDAPPFAPSYKLVLSTNIRKELLK